MLFKRRGLLRVNAKRTSCPATPSHLGVQPRCIMGSAALDMKLGCEQDKVTAPPAVLTAPRWAGC